MTRSLFLAAGACLLLAACGPKKAEAPYNVTLPLDEVMGHVVDPAAWAFWGASGYIDTAEGTINRAPTTDEGWEHAANAAATVAEAGNLLMLPGRARDNGDWMKYAKQLYEAGMRGREAADAHDEKATFDTGGEIYEACTACHEKYLLPFLDDNGEKKK